MPELTADGARRGALLEALGAAAGVTAAVGLVSLAAPERWHTTLVALVFLGATWALVWRGDDARVQASGLALGGLVMPGKLDAWAFLRRLARACAWSVGLLAAVALPFYFGWRAWFGASSPHMTFALVVRPGEMLNELAAQLLVVALPEESFYRGYLQSRLDEAWPPRWRLLGADVGPGWLVGAAIFAAGHLVTVHSATRLAVFFPALVFGWLRARTGGVGASAAFHTLCNVYSQALGRGFGVY